MSNNTVINKVAIIYKTTKGVPMVIEERHLNMIREALPNAEVTFTETEEEMLAKQVNADVLLAWGRISPIRYCQYATNLKWIFSFSAGVEGLIVPEILKLKVKISSAKGIHGLPMSDHVLCYILSFLRGFPTFFSHQNQQIWEKLNILPEETCGKTVGIIGLGEIGKVIAKRCKAFDMRVLGVKRSPVPVEYVDEVFSSEEIDQVLEQSDFIVILIPLTPDTVHYFDKVKLAKMKKTSYLINVGRGPVVDEKALIEVLQEGKIAGAALDATEIEPLPDDSPLWKMLNVIITPHTAADTPYYMDRALSIFCKNIERFQNGERLISEVDLEAKY